MNVVFSGGGGTCPSDRCYPKLPLVDAACAGPTTAFSSPWEIIPDGGGLLSSAAWLAPREQTDTLKGLRNMFLDYARSRALVPRLLEHVSKRCENPLLADDEIHVLRAKMAEFLKVAGWPCTLQVRRHQPLPCHSYWHQVCQLVWFSPFCRGIWETVWYCC